MSNKARRRERQHRERANDRIDDVYEPILKLVKLPATPEKQPKRHWKIPKKDWTIKLPALVPKQCPFKHPQDILCPMCAGYDD